MPATTEAADQGSSAGADTHRAAAKGGSPELTGPQRELLTYLSGVTGADVWERWDAHVCRELETLGFVRIVRAKNAPADGAMRQPFFGVKISAAGRRALTKAVSQ